MTRIMRIRVMMSEKIVNCLSVRVHMVTRSTLISGLDIGTQTTRLVIASVYSEGRIELLGYKSIPSDGIRKGLVINLERATEIVSELCHSLEEQTGLQLSAIVAGLSGAHIESCCSHGIVPIRTHVVRSEDIQRVLDAAQAVVIPQDRDILHIVPREFQVNEKKEIVDPLGHEGVRLEARVNVLTMRAENAESHVKCINRAGFAVDSLVFSGLGTAAGLLTEDEKNSGTCILDIGAGTTDICVFHKGALAYAGCLGIGGNNITNDIAHGLKTSISGAEHIKCVYGAALKSLAMNESIPVPSLGSKSQRAVPRTALASVIEARMRELFQQIIKSLSKGNIDPRHFSKIILTGGGAKLKGISALTEDIFGKVSETRFFSCGGDVLPSSYFYFASGSTAHDETEEGKDIDFVKDTFEQSEMLEQYATVCGLLRYHLEARSCHRRMPRATRVQKSFKRVANWFSDHF